MADALVITVILNTNRREDTLACLESLTRSTYSNHKVIVLDNASTDGSTEAIQSAFPQVEIIAFERDTALPEMIRDGSLDLCITERYFGDPNVPQHLVCTYRPALVLPREWGTPPRGEIRQWVQGRPFVTYEPGQLLRNLAIDYLQPDDVEMEIAISTSGSSSVKRCVEAGLGYAIIPAWCMDGTETTITAIDLPELPEIPIYFGEASFLARNPYVVALRRLCVGFTSAMG